MSITRVIHSDMWKSSEYWPKTTSFSSITFLPKEKKVTTYKFVISGKKLNRNDFVVNLSSFVVTQTVSLLN